MLYNKNIALEFMIRNPKTELKPGGAALSGRHYLRKYFGVHFLDESRGVIMKKSNEMTNSAGAGGAVAKKEKGSDFLFLALYAFAGFAFELLLADLIEPAMGLSIDSLTTLQSIVHWLITCAVWGLVGVILIRVSKNKYGFDIMEERCQLKLWQYLAAAGCIAVMFAAQYADWGGFKPYLEFMKLGTVKFIFQYIYYFFETFLFSLIIIFGQRACEIWFKKKNIPYGGIILALTWGLGHILSKSSLTIGLLSAASGFVFGAAYLVAGRDYRKALPLLFILFAL